MRVIVECLGVSSDRLAGFIPVGKALSAADVGLNAIDADVVDDRPDVVQDRRRNALRLQHGDGHRHESAQRRANEHGLGDLQLVQQLDDDPLVALGRAGLSPARPFQAFEIGARDPFQVRSNQANDCPGSENAAAFAEEAAGTVPVGFTDDGLPVGLQVVGPQHADAAVLRVLAYLEDAIGVDAVAPLPG